MITVADRIRQRRIQLGLSQEELAIRANYKDKTSICHLEHLGNEVTMKQVKRLAPALETTQAYLMGWETEQGETIPSSKETQALDIAIRDAMIEPYNTDQIKHAVDFCKKYLAADPNLQNAIDLLLKGNQSDV